MEVEICCAYYEREFVYLNVEKKQSKLMHVRHKCT